MTTLPGSLLLISLFIVYGAVATHFSRLDIFQPNFHQTQRYRDTRSAEEPNVEVWMQLPPEFKDVDAFRKFLGGRSERRKRSVEIPENRPTREADLPTSSNVESTQLLVEDSLEGLPFSAQLQARRYPDAVVEIADGRPIYSQYANPTASESDDPRKRRNTSANDHEDKRSYPDLQDATTAAPAWKQKKASLPFITSREGRGQSSTYDNPQHRSSDNARESHSMKEPTKSMASNEIPRMQDNYYSGTSSSTRRAYNSRQADSPLPKSVYDTLDYSTNRRGQSRNTDSTGRLTDYAYNRPYLYPRSYDSRYYSPLPGEVGPRGADYYHRTIDPGTGRVVYYATLPEPGPSYDPYSGRTLPGRAYTYDTYGRAYPTLPLYPTYSNYGPVPEYLRNGRNVMEPYQKQRLDSDRYRDDPRNKTYVIYDAEEKRVLPRPSDDRYRYSTPPPYIPYPNLANYPTYVNQPGFVNYPTPGYQPFVYRNNYYPEARTLIGGEGNVRDIQLPLSSRSTISAYDKLTSKSMKP